MYEDLSTSRLHALVAVAQSRLYGDYSTEIKEIAAYVVEDIQQEIIARNRAEYWKLEDKKSQKISKIPLDIKLNLC